MQSWPDLNKATDALEPQYRAHYLAADARQTSVAIAVWMVPVLLFAYADYHFFGAGPKFAASLALRVAFCAFSLFTIRALAKVATAREYDGIFLRWALVGAAVVLYFNYSWAEYVSPTGAITVLVLFSSYMVFPTRLSVRLVAPLMLSVGNFLLQVWVALPFSPMSLFTTAVALAMANVLGIVFSSWLQNHRRTEYRARVEETRVKEEYSRLATIDDLTGAFNRRKLMEIAAGEFERFKRSGQPMSVLMIDIDHFKKLNDNFGHEAGDLIMTSFTANAGKSLREKDILGRLGGDEFVLVLPGATSEVAEAVAERLRLAIREPVVWHDNPLAFTVSIGATEARENDKSIDNVLKRADKALYIAKRKGRSRTEVL